MAFHIDKKNFLDFHAVQKGLSATSSENCQITSKSIFVFMMQVEIAYFSFNDDLKPDFKVFGNVLIFFTNKFPIKSGLTSTLSSSLHVYYKFRRLVIKNYYREIIAGFSLTWADP
jgi:hypothetical protein